MRKYEWIILLIVSLISFCGCIETESTQKEPAHDLDITGIKLKDIAPAYTVSQPKAVRIELITLEIDAEKLFYFRSAVNTLVQRPIRFANKQIFLANGLLAGFGSNRMWDNVAAKLRKANLTRIGAHSLIIFDDKGDDIAVSVLRKDKTVFYTQSQGDVAAADLSAAAKIGWKIKARPSPRIKGTAEVKVMAVYGPKLGIQNIRAVRQNDPDRIEFDSTAFVTRMGPGDFLIIGPGQFEIDDTILANALFEGNHTEKIRVKIYVLVCTGVN
jgi:hypothetical protein